MPTTGNSSGVTAERPFAVTVRLRTAFFISRSASRGIRAAHGISTIIPGLGRAARWADEPLKNSALSTSVTVHRNYYLYTLYSYEPYKNCIRQGKRKTCVNWRRLDTGRQAMAPQ